MILDALKEPPICHFIRMENIYHNERRSAAGTSQRIKFVYFPMPKTGEGEYLAIRINFSFFEIRVRSEYILNFYVWMDKIRKRRRATRNREENREYKS